MRVTASPVIGHDAIRAYQISSINGDRPNIRFRYPDEKFSGEAPISVKDVNALAAGETNPAALAAMADKNLRATPAQLCDALGACKELRPIYRRLLTLFLEELQLIGQQISQLDQELANLLSRYQASDYFRESLGWFAPPNLLGRGSRHCHGINCTNNRAVVKNPRMFQFCKCRNSGILRQSIWVRRGHLFARFYLERDRACCASLCGPHTALHRSSFASVPLYSLHYELP